MYKGVIQETTHCVDSVLYLYHFYFLQKESLVELQWLCDNTEKLTVLFVPQMQRLT